MSYRRDMNSDRFGNNMGRGYGNNQPPLNPWNNAGGSLLGQSPNLTDNATLLLANNLLNILSNKSQMLPSLLDMNPMQNQYGSGGMGSMNSSYGNSSKMFNANRPNMNMNSRLAPLMGNFGSPQRNLNQSRFNPRAQASSTQGNGPRTGGVKRNSNQFKKGPGSANKNIKNATNNRSNKQSSSGSGSDNKNKRDWKDEKKDSEQKNSDHQSPKKVKNETEEEGDTKNSTAVAIISPGKKNQSQNIVTEFDGLDKQYYHCHICKKNMWDGQSFQKHLKGRAHLSMMSGLSDSYGMRAQMLRHEMRMAENARQIEFERKRRLGKGGYSGKKPLEFCTMCDLDFMVMGPTSHRATAGHLKLKNLLHPKCANCNVDFSNPVEYDQHLLSALHLKKLSELGIMKVSGVEEEYKSFTEQCEITGIDLKKLAKSLKKKSGDDVKTQLESTEKDVVESTKIETGEDQEIIKKDAEDGEQKQENDGKPKNDKLMDYNENTDLTGITTANLPEYNPRSAVGMSFLEEKTCYLCNLCHVYLTNSEAVTVHARSPRHHEYFVQTVKKHLASAKAANEANANKRNERDDEEQLDDDNAGHWKRRKTNTSLTSNNDTTGDDQNEKPSEMYEPESCLLDQEHEEAADEISKLMDDVEQDEEALLNANLAEGGLDVLSLTEMELLDSTGDDEDFFGLNKVEGPKEQPEAEQNDKTQIDEKPAAEDAIVNSSTENLVPTVVVENITEPVKKEEQQSRSTPTRRGGGATAVRGNRARRGTPRRN